MVKRKGTQEEKIALEAIEILKSNRDGVRFTELTVQIKAKYPNINSAALGRTVSLLDKRKPKEIYKPARGLFRLVKFREEEVKEEEVKEEEIKEEPESEKPLREEAFYEPFAEWLVNDLEECTKAIPLGKKVFGEKWGTPDVIGLRHIAGSPITIPTEVVSAEIKTDTTSKELLEGFGQACAYRLFSHHVYLVIPKTSGASDIGRLESLCRVLGLGLVLFNNSDIEKPDFTVKVWSVKREPDILYVNEKMEILWRDKRFKRKLF
jgi:hypothetical protein